jgi:type 1 glutamine amidotransferase
MALRTGCGILAVMAAGSLWAGDPVPGHDPSKIQVLLITGYNSTPNHRWREIDPMLREILEQSARCEVRLEEEPRGIGADTFAPYDVLLLDYSNYTPSLGAPWSAATRQAYLDFLNRGGGVVAFHVSIGSFPEWPEFHRSVGIAENRGIGHGPYHAFRVKVTEPGHPIAAGLPAQFEQSGEIYNGFTLLPDARVLATAFDDPHNCLPDETHCGGGRDEPIFWTFRTGAGRVFATALGHDRASVDRPEFRRSLAQGVEWAAGKSR